MSSRNFAVVRRDELIDAFAVGWANVLKRAQPLSNDIQAFAQLSGGSVGVALQKLEGSLDAWHLSSVFVPARDLGDFLAWLATFVQQATPLSRFAHIVTEQDAHWRGRLGEGYDQRFLDMLLGVAFMESALLLKRLKLGADRADQMAVRTLSFVVLQGMMSGCDWDAMERAFKEWIQLRAEFSGQETPIDEMVLATATWRELLGPKFSMPPADQEIGELLGGAFSDSSSELMVARLSEMAQVDVQIVATGPREDRFRAATMLAQQVLARSRFSRTRLGAWGGALLSLVAEGDFGMWPTAIEWSRYAPDVPLWYGCFSQLHTRANARTLIANFSERFVRSAASDVHATGDIDFRELKALQQSKVDIRSLLGPTIRVRVGGIGCSWTSAREPQLRAGAAVTVVRKEPSLSPGFAMELTQRVERAERLAEDLLRTLRPSSEGSQQRTDENAHSSKQPNLFEGKQPRKRRK